MNRSSRTIEQSNTRNFESIGKFMPHQNTFSKINDELTQYCFNSSNPKDSSICQNLSTIQNCLNDKFHESDQAAANQKRSWSICYRDGKTVPCPSLIIYKPSNNRDAISMATMTN
jgi:hypothetical protein